MQAFQSAGRLHAAFVAAVWLAVLAAAPRPSFGATPRTLAEWQGEYFQKKQGGVFVKVALRGFRAEGRSEYISSNIQIFLRNLLSGESFLLSHRLADVSGGPVQVFKIPSGKYRIQRIIMVDAMGTKRMWRSSKLHSVLVRRLCISNLGLWILSPKGKQGLQVRFSMVPNSYREDGSKEESSVVAVLNGFNGLIQQRFGGKKLLQAAKNNFASKNEMRKTVTFDRQIAMFYRLDLFKHNRYAKEIASVLSVYDSNMRTCYTDRLEVFQNLRGHVTYTFILSKSTGSMSKIKYKEGSLKDPKLVECLYFQLGQISFPVHETMIGEVSYNFDVR